MSGWVYIVLGVLTLLFGVIGTLRRGYVEQAFNPHRRYYRTGHPLHFWLEIAWYSAWAFGALAYGIVRLNSHR